MLIHPYHAEIERHRRREMREEMRRQRMAAAGRPPRRIRRVLGRSMVRIGSRLAAEPSPELARLR